MKLIKTVLISLLIVFSSVGVTGCSHKRIGCIGTWCR